MPPMAETVVAFDATERLSPRHIVKRNGEHVAACGDPLQPFGRIRYAESFDSGRDYREADCRPCLFARARTLVEDFDGSVPGDVAAAVNRLPDTDVDTKIEVLLAHILRTTAWQPSVLLNEHFPAAIVERAEVRAEAREV